ncbi:glucosamine-6-phosphate deaminase [Paenibacillus beijingensis]|uniref:Glucosamine-6-phosphate deaminase n=1 Tax=Paenibacillus beijingensis TaxID=1126833 RepID=A0A0D5NPF0_9BACL|nr:glucosamine-6-phosphate deaminase [Paenibacillus beijingensis]AJY76892.1 glucosamine-6-phosphate deaminase [Paenibacillus beijingensis]
MIVEIKQNYNELSYYTALMIAEYVGRKPDCIMCLAAGNTPVGTLRYLVQMAQEQKVDFGTCRFVGLDEWVGMDKTSDGSAQETLYQEFFSPLSIRPSQIHFFEALSDDLQSECKRIDDYIATEGPIDLMLLGLGVNGHLGLNEPGVDFDSGSHVTELSQTTVTVGQKYFKQRQELTGGITLGIRQIMESETVILIASGKNKADAVYRLQHGEVTNELPASILQRHTNCFVILDQDAAETELPGN